MFIIYFFFSSRSRHTSCALVPGVQTFALPISYDAALEQHKAHWLVREIRLFLKRTLKRIDVSSRSIFALIEPGSCFTGTLLELALAADRSYMLDGRMEGDNRPPATLRMTPMNFGPYPMPNGLSRIASRNLDNPANVAVLEKRIGEDRKSTRLNSSH